MQCPKCGYSIPDNLVVRENARIQGYKGGKAAKARDPEKMRAAGRLGGLAKAKKLRAEAAAKKRNAKKK